MAVESMPPQRPWHLWVLGALGLAWSGLGAFDYVMTVARNEAYLSQFPKEMLDYFFALPTWYYAVWGVGIAGGVLGSIALLARSRLAVPLLTFSLAGTLFSFYVGLTDPAAPPIPGMKLMPLIVTAFSVMLLVYAVAQRRRGVLI